MRGKLKMAGMAMLAVTAPSFGQIGSALTGYSAAGRTGSNTDQLVEIVVTAERRAENLQNVPISVTAVSPDRLLDSGVKNIQDLSLLVPGLEVAINGATSNTYLRGVGSQALGAGVESPIALYVDGIYYASQFAYPADFINVDQVAVLKGPQGTLFGRNATGGLIQITTKTPTQDSHVDAGFTYGNYNTSKLNLYGTAGLASNLAADIAVQASYQGDGYGTNSYNAQDVYKTNVELGLRSKWLFTPGDATRLTVILDYSKARSSNNSLRIYPGSSLPPFLGPQYTGSPYDTEVNVQPRLDYQGGGISARLERDLGLFNLVGTLSYRDSYTLANLDIDATATPFQGAALTEKEHQFTQELQLLSARDSRVTWTAGLFYFNDRASDAPTLLNLDTVPKLDPFFPVTTLRVSGTEAADSLAGYLQASLQVLPATHLTLGARETWERRKVENANMAGFIGPLRVPLLDGFSTSKDYNRPTYRLSLDHRFAPEWMTYVSWSTGFKSGGYNLTAPTQAPYRPETLTAFAIGSKSDWLDRRVRVNMEGFYYQYNGIQVAYAELGSPGIANGASAHNYGIDWDAAAQVTSAFRITGALEWLHARFKSYPDAFLTSVSGAGPTVVGSADGNSLPQAPDAVMSLAGDYVVNLFGGKMNLNLTYSYNSGYYLESDNFVHQSEFSLVNASVRWQAPGDRYSAQLWGKNLGNTQIIQNAVSEAFGGVQSGYLPPRTYGFTVGYYF